MKIMNLFMYMCVKEIQAKMQPKSGLQNGGNCILANNNSRIPTHDLKKIFRSIEANYFFIISEWKKFYGIDEVKFYC